MEAKKIFDYLKSAIHTVIMATNDDNGNPVTCAVDIMDYDENGLYFLTAKGKNFYSRLKKNGYLSLTGINGEDTMSRVAVTVCGKVKEVGSERLKRLLDKNSYMYEIYPTECSRSALTVFYIYKGNGEWFDLSKKPIERYSFSFGSEDLKEVGYFITDKCNACGKCLTVCPQNCVEINVKADIWRENCLNCGNCIDICPLKAVIRK